MTELRVSNPFHASFGVIEVVGTGIYDKAKVLGRTKITASDDQWFIGDFCLVTVPELILGGHCQVNAGAKILGRETVTIGRGSVVSYDVLILTSSDSPNPPQS